MFLNTASELKPYYISTNEDYAAVRKIEQIEALNILKRERFVFIEAGLGSGLYGFVYSLAMKYKFEKNYFKLNFSEVLVKNQIDDCFVAYTGVNPQLLIFEMNRAIDTPYILIIDNIRADIEQEALSYLIQLVKTATIRNEQVYFIFSSTITFTQFQNLTVKLRELTFDETSLILKKKFNSSKLDTRSIIDLHNLSEGIIVKLDHIINCLNYSSPDEILSEQGLFDDIYQSDDIPRNIITQIDYISKQPDKQLTFMMLKILSILKNGESLTNLKRDKLGKDLTLKNSREIIQLGLASVIEIDTATTLIKLNPIVKDYVLSLLSEEDIFTISNAYLKLVVNETKEGIHLGITNRKIIDKGYNTEEDNAVVLFKNSINQSKSKIESNLTTDEEKERAKIKTSKLLYLSLAYVYSLDNSSRYKEAIYAATSLLNTTESIGNPFAFKLYYHLGSCQRMLNFKDEALFNLRKARELCPLNEKHILEKIYIEELFILEETDIKEAISIAKRTKRGFKANSLGHINSEYITSAELNKGQRIAKLESLERKCRRLGYHTTANNILFTLNTIKEDADKISVLNKVMDTDSNNFNYCKAMIFKHEILISNKEYDKVTDRDLNELINIFNYMFKQGFNSLLNRCHDLIWQIADYKRLNKIIIVIYFKSAISWQLNNNMKMIEKYNALLEDIDIDKYIDEK